MRDLHAKHPKTFFSCINLYKYKFTLLPRGKKLWPYKDGYLCNPPLEEMEAYRRFNQLSDTLLHKLYLVSRTLVDPTFESISNFDFTKRITYMTLYNKRLTNV